LNTKTLMIIGAVGAAIVVAVVLWRNTPYQKAVRLLNKAAGILTVAKEDGTMARRIKAGRLRKFVGYEVHVDVEGIANACDLMQNDVLAAWAYAVGASGYLNIDIIDVEVVDTADDKIVLNVDMSIESNYQNGRYSGGYPLVIELVYVERKLRVGSLKSRLSGDR
jgi:hypothetical protein